MRFFDRSKVERPKIFDSPEMEDARREVDRYLSETGSKSQSQRRFQFNDKLIQNETVRNALIRCFEGVCAYCETRLEDGSWFADGFRPRDFAEDQSGNTVQTYYSWLAYEWDNLYPVCPQCSQAKRNRFFVAKRHRGRFGAPITELRKTENALIIDPCFDDIADHLTFAPNGLAIAQSDVGAGMIIEVDLNRENLIKSRWKAFREIAKNLNRNPESFFAIATGVGDGWSAYILEMPDEKFDHMGAFCLALLGVADRVVGVHEDVDDLLQELQETTPSERLRLMNVFIETEAEDVNSSEATDTSWLDVHGPRKGKHSRNVRKEDVPAAEYPISSVHISNFKALAGVDFTIPERVDNPNLVPCLLILGENATGKSSVLEAISLALLGTRETAELDELLKDEDISPESLQHRPSVENWDELSKDPLKVEIKFLGQEEPAALFSQPGEDEFQGDETPSKIMMAYGPRRYFVNRQTRRFRAPAYRIRSLFDPMDVIARPHDWLLGLTDEKQFDAAVRALRIVLMLDDDAEFIRDKDRILVDTPQGQTPLSRMSVGYKSIIAMAIDIMRELFYHYDNLENAHGVVLVDEIETHLHPRWKMRIVGLLREAFPKVQFILTTHDPLCLRGMYQGEVFVLQRNESDRRIETLTELPNVEGMRAEQILTSEFFGLGSTNPSTDAKLERYHFLTAKSELSVPEQAERSRLSKEIENRMTVGSTIEEQTEAKAMSEASKDGGFKVEKPVQFRNGDRRRMIEQALQRLQSD